MPPLAQNSNLNKLNSLFYGETSENVIDIFTDENSEINPYYQRFKSHEFELVDLGNLFELSFSKQGLVELKTSSQDQALEIVRRRIDEVGTNEPNILKRGNDRVLVELPGFSGHNHGILHGWRLFALRLFPLCCICYVLLAVSCPAL